MVGGTGGNGVLYSFDLEQAALKSSAGMVGRNHTGGAVGSGGMKSAEALMD